MDQSRVTYPPTKAASAQIPAVRGSTWRTPTEMSGVETSSVEGDNGFAFASGSRYPDQIPSDDFSQGQYGTSRTALHGVSRVQAGDDNPSSSEAGRQIEPFDVEEEQDVAPGAAQSKAQQLPLLPSVLRHCAILGLLTFTAIWGLLTREGLIALNTYDGQSIKPVIWVQAVGCLVMGWTLANKEVLEAWYPPAFIMMGTGYCGSVTTFSSWILNVFQAYGNQSHYNHDGLHNVMDALTQTFATLGISIAALTAGKHLARVLPAAAFCRLFDRRSPPTALLPNDPNSSTQAIVSAERHLHEQAKASVYPHTGHSARTIPSQPRSNTHTTIYPDLFCFLVLGVGFWVGAILLAGFPPRSNFRPLTFSIVFSPPGTILRWYLSRLNSISASKRFPYWPLGTFAANIFATLVVSVLFVLQHYGPTGSRLAASDVTTCQVLFGLQEGFCGCLSTISTFAVELCNLQPKRRAVGYAVGSYVVGIVVCVLVIGAPWWSRGMDGSCEGLLSYPK